MNVLSAIPQPWRRRLLIGGSVALALVAAFVAGRYSAPKRVEERVEYREIASYRTEWAVRTEYQDRTKIQARIVTVEKVAPDGARETTRTEETGTQVAIDSGTVASGGEAGEVEQHASAVKVETSGRPGWRVGGQVGWDLERPVLRPSLYGLQVERRLAGTIWLGAWGRTDKTAGLSLALEW